MSDTATTATPAIASRLGAEVLGTFWLVLGGCGTVIFAASSGSEFDRVAVALAFGLTVVTGAYAFGHISGAHFNPAVTVGLATAKRFAWKDVPAYVVAQIVGASIAGAVLLAIANGKDGFEAEGNMATNGYGNGGFELWSVFLAEAVLTAVFLYVILGATAKRATAGFAGLSIGLCLTLIHLIAIPIDGTSVNPARSLGVAWFGGGDALEQVWLFLVAPLVGAIIAGISHALIVGEKD